MPKKTPPAATQDDIRSLMEHIDGQIRDLYDAEERWKNEIKHHFDVAVEHIRTELRGANKDEIESVKSRVTRLEQHVGIAG